MIIARSEKLVKRQSSVKHIGSWDLESLSTEDSLGLEGLYCNPCIQLIH